MNQDQLNDWKYHPVTQEIFKLIDGEVSELKDALPIITFNSVEETALINAEAKGILRGLGFLKEAHERLAEDAK